MRTIITVFFTALFALVFSCGYANAGSSKKRRSGKAKPCQEALVKLTPLQRLLRPIPTAASNFRQGFESIENHQMMNVLAENLKQGEDLVFYSELFWGGQGTSIALGESIQTYFIQSVLEFFFPKARFTTHFNDIREGETVADIHVRDHAEKQFYRSKRALTLAKKGRLIPITELKPVVQFDLGLSRREIRKALKIGQDARIVHFYTNGSDGVFSWGTEAVTKKLIAYLEQHFDILILTVGNKNRKERNNLLSSEHRDNDFYKRGIMNLKFSDYSDKARLILRSLSDQTRRTVTREGLIVNRSTGKLPYLHALADHSVVLGPINFFEPLQVGTPTTVLTDGSYSYSDFEFERLIELARSMGANIVDDIDSMNEEDFASQPIEDMRRVQNAQMKRLLDFLSVNIPNSIESPGYRIPKNVLNFRKYGPSESISHDTWAPQN